MKFYLFSFLLIFLVFSCKEEVDLCENVTCNNDGICNEGVCDCPPEFMGGNCDELAPVTAIKINKIYVTEYLPLNNGTTPWDEESAPDIFVEVSSSTLNFPLETEIIQDAENNIEHVFDVDWRIEGVETTAQVSLITFKLYDFDEGPNGYMGLQNFFIVQNREEKPTIIEFPYNGGLNCGLRAEIEWIFE